VVEGEVLTVEEDEIILNIGYKSDGVISKSDYSRDKDINLTEEVKVGDKVEAVITDLNDGTGNVKLSRTKFEGRKIQTQLRESYENKTVLEGTIQSVSGKGLIVDVGFTTIYMPASQYHVKYIKDLDTLVGKEVKGIIIDYNQRQRRAILSQKVLIEEEYQARKAKEKENKEKRFAELNIDDVVSGTVKTIKDFGIFVDLDGIDGFIHRSDLTWTRINSPKDVVSQGDTIEAKVIEKNDEELKIKLSKKALEEEPWDVFVKTYEVGSIVPVTVTKIMPYGAFAKIIPGVEGLLHISEISYKRVEKVETELSEGQEIEVKIIGIDEDKKKISLSIKATEKAPARQRDDSVFEKPAFKKASSAPRKQRPRKNSAGNMNAGNAEQAVHTEQMENSLGDLSALSGLLDSLPEDDTAEEA
jgi:4-hydroxy-3-methylbut-2-enyl diphosphate reductase